MELGTGERPNYTKPEPENEDGALVMDTEHDENRSHKATGTTTGRPSLRATGNPRTTEPRKTWLDEMALECLKVIIGKYPYIKTDGTEEFNNAARSVIEANVRGAYTYATAMLAEKMKREAKE